MKEIRTFEKAIEEKVRSLKDVGINPTLFWAYRTSKEESGNDLIDFTRSFGITTSKKLQTA